MSRSRAPSFTSSGPPNDPPSRRTSFSRSSFGSGFNPSRIRLKPLTPLDKTTIAPHSGSPVQSPSAISDHHSFADYIPVKSQSVISHSERSIPNRSYSSRGVSDPVVDLYSSSHLGSVKQNSLPHYSLGQRDNESMSSQQQTRQGRSRAPSYSVGKNEVSGQTYVRRASSTQRSFTSHEAFEDSTDAEEYAKKRHARRASTYARDPSAVSAAASPSILNAVPLPDTQEQSYEVRTDAETFVLTTGIIFGRLPLNKPQTDKPLGKLLSIVMNWKELLGQFKDTFSAIQLTPSEATEYTVVWHDLTSQLYHLSRYVYNEEEITNYISAKSEFIKRKLDSSNSTSLNNHESSSLSWDRLAENTAYSALLLDILVCLARLTLILVPHLNSFISSLLNSGDKDTVNFSKLYDALTASFVHLTGDTVHPLIKAFSDWYEIAQDVILDFADEVQEFMLSPVSLPEAHDFVRHPLTGKPYSPSETQIRVNAIATKARIMLLEEPHRSSLIKSLKCLSRLVDGVHGNSEWVRWIRSIKRLWTSLTREETTVDDWADALQIISQKFLQLPLDDIETGDESSTCKLSNVVINFENIVPEQVSFKKESTVSFGRGKNNSDGSPCVQQYILQLSNVAVAANKVSFAYTKEKAMGISDQGSVDVAMKVDINIVFARDDNSAQKLTWPRYISSDVKISDFKLEFEGTIKNALYQNILLPFIQTSIVETIQSKSYTWFSEQLAFWFPRQGILPARTAAKRRRYVAPIVTKPVQPSVTSQQIPASARDAFRQNIRKVPDLQSNVLDKLENPFSNVSSNAPSEIGDDTTKEPRKMRRKSMAEYLTTESSKDATLEENISAPPTAVSAPGAIKHEDAYAYENMASSLSDVNKSDTTTMEAIKVPPVHPSNFLNTNSRTGIVTDLKSRINSFGEMSYDQYEQAIADDEDDIAKDSAMARSLSEFTSRDATTLAAIKSPLVAPGSGATYTEGVEDISNARPSRPSMSKVTRDLSGLTSSEPASAVLAHDVSASAVPYQPRARSMSVHSSYSQPVSGPTSRRSSMKMADTLDYVSSRDYTTPEAQSQFYNRASSRTSQRSDASGLSREELLARKKSFSLNEEASKDATLTENIAHGSMPPSAAGSPIMSTTPLTSSRRMSVVSSASVPRSPYTGFSNSQVLPMSATLSEEAQVDQTTPEGQAELHKRKPSNTEQGFDRAYVRRKSMSSFLSDTAKLDTTLYNNVVSPPSDQGKPELEEEPSTNPLQRRPSIVKR